MEDIKCELCVDASLFPKEYKTCSDITSEITGAAFIVVDVAKSKERNQYLENVINDVKDECDKLITYLKSL